MFKFVVVLAACWAAAAAAAAAGVVLPAAAVPVAYANAPLYAAGGSQQIDVRNNYDGTLSSYTTTPFGYTSPVSNRYVAGVPAAVAGPAAFAAPIPVAAPAPSAVPAAYAAPTQYAALAPLPAAPAKLVF